MVSPTSRAWAGMVELKQIQNCAAIKSIGRKEVLRVSIRSLSFRGPLLCATSVFSVSLWCVFAQNSSTTETQRTQRLHREIKASTDRSVDIGPQRQGRILCREC